MIELDGLTELQRDLYEVVKKKLPKESKKVMRKVGSKARTKVARKSRTEVHKVTGNFQKGWVREKVKTNADGELCVTVKNYMPHAHLIENGHRMVTKNGREYGFRPGKKILERSMEEFDESGEFGAIVSDWLDDLLDKNNL